MGDSGVTIPLVIEVSGLRSILTVPLRDLLVFLNDSTVARGCDPVVSVQWIESHTRERVRETFNE